MGRLNDYFTPFEWDAIENLNDAINPKLHHSLETGFDGIMKEVVLPVEFIDLKKTYQKIAKKSLKSRIW